MFAKLTLQRLSAKLEGNTPFTYEEIESAFGEVIGVQGAGVDNPTGIVRVDYDPKQVNKAELLKVLESLGYPYQILDPDGEMK